MDYEWMLPAAYFCLGMTLGAPIYLIIFRNRFWSAFFAAWFFIVAEAHFSVYHGLIELDRGLVTSASDTTSIGLTMFSGWLVSLPYCAILVLVRKILRATGVIGSEGGGGGGGDHPPSGAELDG